MPPIAPLPESLWTEIGERGTEAAFVTCLWLAAQTPQPELRASLLADADRLADDVGAWRARRLRELVAEAA